MFRESADKEQELYQAVARAGTLLLQIGDAANEDDETRSYSNPSFGKCCEAGSDSHLPIQATDNQPHNELHDSASFGKLAVEKPDDTGLTMSGGSRMPEDLGLNVRVQGMTLAEALADAQRSLSSSPGRTESIKSEDYVYVNESQESGSRTSPETSQENVGKTEYEATVGSSYKEIASCIGESPDSLYKEFGNETTQSSPLSRPGNLMVQRTSERSIGASAVVSERPSSTGDPGTVSDKWSVGFRQFIACVLSEPSLVEFFEQRYDIKNELDRASSESLLSKSPDDSTLDQAF